MILRTALFTLLVAFNLGFSQQSKSIYLDDSQPIEKRVEDALSKMTLDEKIAMIHAQSKFSSPGVARLGIPGFGQPMDLMEFVQKYSGTNGIKQVGQTILLLHIQL